MCRTHHVALTLGALAVAIIRFAAAEPMLFSAPVNLSEINSDVMDRDPCLSADGLEIFFVSARPGGVSDWDIWRATRSDTDSPFGSPENVSELNSPGADGRPYLSRDGLTIYFHRAFWPDPARGHDLYCATRPDRFSPFSEPLPITELNTTYGEASPCISPDGLTIYFARKVSNDFHEDLYFATRLAPSDPFGPGVRIDELSTSFYDRDPRVSSDGLAMYFASNRDGTHEGDFDIFLSERASLSAPFGAPCRLVGVNTVENDSSPFFDEGRDLLYFHSNGLAGAHGGNQAVDIWVSRVVPEPSSVVLMLSGFGAVVARRLRRRPKRGPH